MPKQFSLTSFIATEVLVDVEAVVNILGQHWPVHGKLHSLVGAAGIGVAAGGVTYLVGILLQRWFQNLTRHRYVQSDLSLVPAIAGGLVGGVSASLLDAVMHSDVQPFWPFSSSNPLLGIVGIKLLHIACGLSAAVGLAILMFRSETA